MLALAHRSSIGQTTLAPIPNWRECITPCPLSCEPVGTRFQWFKHTVDTIRNVERSVEIAFSHFHTTTLNNATVQRWVGHDDILGTRMIVATAATVESRPWGPTDRRKSSTLLNGATFGLG